MELSRTILAQKYLRGNGIELGACNTPWPNPNKAVIQYADVYDFETLKKRNPTAKNIIPVTLKDDLRDIPGASQDFVVNSHVIEHTRDPIGALENWLRVVRQGGFVVMAIPEMDHTFDKGREQTPWTHVFEDYHSPEPHKGEEEAHFHCWTTPSLKYFFQMLQSYLASFRVIEFQFVGFEVFVVLEKL